MVYISVIYYIRVMWYSVHEEVIKERSPYL